MTAAEVRAPGIALAVADLPFFVTGLDFDRPYRRLAIRDLVVRVIGENVLVTGFLGDPAKCRFHGVRRQATVDHAAGRASDRRSRR